MRTISFSIKLGLLGFGLAAITASQAETVYVDWRAGTNGNGTLAAPFDTIQRALAPGQSQNVSEIIVYPGTYHGQIEVTTSMAIIGYDGPHTTKVEASSGGDAISIKPGILVTIQGLTISSGVRGVYQPTLGTLYLRNCIVCGNTSHGIHVERTETATAPQVFIDNCVVVANGGSGIYVSCVNDYYSYAPNIRAFNNILIGNQRYTLEANMNDWLRSILADGTITLDYNDYVGSALGNYSGLFGPGQEVSIGVNSINIAPEFVGGSASPCTQDFHLVPTSPCRNKGQPGLGWLNPDGTRNDMGAYGGPGAATFYANPNDGPFIRSISIDPGVVPRGSTATIRVKAATR